MIKLKKLNNKGMTIVEILVTFIIVIVMVASLYASINNLQNKQKIAAYKEELTTYKDLLVRDIERDLIAKKAIDITGSGDNYNIIFSDGSSKSLNIGRGPNQNYNKNSLSPCKQKTNVSQNPGYIQYGDQKFELPNLGSSNVSNGGSCFTLYDLKIGDNIDIRRANHLISDTNRYFLIIKIELVHPDLGNKFSINIVYPVYK